MARLMEHASVCALYRSRPYMIPGSTSISAGNACEEKRSTSASTAVAFYAMDARGMTTIQEVWHACNPVYSGTHFQYQVLVTPSLQGSRRRTALGSTDRSVAQAMEGLEPDEVGANESAAKSPLYMKVRRICQTCLMRPVCGQHHMKSHGRPYNINIRAQQWRIPNCAASIPEWSRS